MSCLTNPSPIRFCTGDHGIAEPNRNHRLAPHNSARQTGTKASARRSLDQAAPGQAQDTHQTKRRQGNRRTPSEASTRQGKLPPQLRQADRCQGKRKALARPNSARTSAGRSQGSPPGQTPATTPPGRQAPWQTQDTHQTKQRQGKRRALPRQPTKASTRRANPSGHPPDQAAPGIQTEIASLNGDRRFQLQRSGTISSGPLKKLRVSCVHERDGKQVPCVRSLCSYARESRAC